MAVFGATAYFTDTALDSGKNIVKAGPFELYGYHIYNPNTTDVYLQLFNALTANVTLGSTAPKPVWWIPAQSGIETFPGSGGSGQPFSLTFSTGLVIANTTTSTGATAPTTGILINLYGA